MSNGPGTTPQGAVVAIGVPDSQDYPRLVFSAPYFEQVPLAELIEPAVTEAVEAMLPSLVPPFVDQAAQAAVNQLAVLLAGSTMQGPLYLNPVMPTQPSQAASMAYVDSMIATAGIPEVPPTPIGQVWARETGQWVPISQSGGTYLPLGGGTMQGQINMSGNAITNLPALPVMPNGAAPAQWVLQQISAVSLYQGTWNMDTYTPDLTQLSTHVNGWTWIAITTSASGVVIGPPIPGLQGQTVFNGDTVIYSATAGAFQAIHSGGLTLAEANALYLSLNGGQLSGPLLLNANATQPTQAVTLQQLQTLVAGYVAPDAPTDGQGYLRVGATQGWTPGLPLTGGVTTGPILLSGNATNALAAVPYQQLVSYTAANYLPTAGGTLVGPLVLAGNATAPLNPVTLTQLTSMLGSYVPLAGGVTVTGTLQINGLLTTANQTVTGNLTMSGANSVLTIPARTSSSSLQFAGVPTGLYATNNNSYSQLGMQGSGLLFQDNTGGQLICWNAVVVGAGDFDYITTGPAAAMTVNALGLNLYCAPGGAAGGNIAWPAPVTIDGGANVYLHTFYSSVYGNNYSWAFNWVNNYGNADNWGLLANIDGSEQVVVWGINAPPSWFPPVNIAVAGGGASMASNVAFAGAGYTVTWPVNNNSDRRLKSNIADPNVDAITTVKALKVHQADMSHPRPDKRSPDRLHYDFCFIADEVEQVVPHAVCKTPEPEKGYDILNPLHLVPVLWKAVQDLTARLEALEGSKTAAA